MPKRFKTPLERPCKNVTSVVRARRNAAKKRGLPAINEHFERALITVRTNAIVFTRPIERGRKRANPRDNYPRSGECNGGALAIAGAP